MALLSLPFSKEIFDISKNTFSSFSSEGRDDNNSNASLIFIKKDALFENNILTIKVAYGIIEAKGSNTFVVGNETITANASEVEKIVLENHLNQLNQFSITFKKDIDHYIFQNFEKIG